MVNLAKGSCREFHSANCGIWWELCGRGGLILATMFFRSRERGDGLEKIPRNETTDLASTGLWYRMNTVRIGAQSQLVPASEHRGGP